MGKELPKPKGEDGVYWRDNRGDEYFNKPDHRARSIANQPNHVQHWVKEEKKKEEPKKEKKP
jgi:hypothetical protein